MLSKPLIMHFCSNHEEVVESSPKSSISIFGDMAKNKTQDQANSFVKVAFCSRWKQERIGDWSRTFCDKTWSKKDHNTPFLSKLSQYVR